MSTQSSIVASPCATTAAAAPAAVFDVAAQPVDMECPVCWCLLDQPVTFVSPSATTPATTTTTSTSSSEVGDCGEGGTVGSSSSSPSSTCGHSVCRRDAERLWASARAWARAPVGAVRDVPPLDEGQIGQSAAALKPGGNVIYVKCPACGIANQVCNGGDETEITLPFKVNEPLLKPISVLRDQALTPAECHACKDKATWRCNCAAHTNQQNAWFVCDDCIVSSKKIHMKVLNMKAELGKLCEEACVDSECPKSEAGCTAIFPSGEQVPTSSPSSVHTMLLMRDNNMCLVHSEPLKCSPSGQQHKNVPVEDSAHEKVKELQSLSERLESQVLLSKSTIDVVQKSEVILYTSAKQAISEIAGTREKAIYLINQHSEYLINKVTEASLSKGSQLEKQKTLLGCHLQALEEEQKNLGRILKSSDNLKVLRLFQRLRSTALDLLSSPIVVAEPCLVPAVEFVPNLPEQFFILCNNFGYILPVVPTDFHWKLGNSSEDNVAEINSRLIKLPISVSLLKNPKCTPDLGVSGKPAPTAELPRGTIATSKPFTKQEEETSTPMTVEVWEEHLRGTRVLATSQYPENCHDLCEVSCCLDDCKGNVDTVAKRWNLELTPKKVGDFWMNILYGNKPVNSKPIRLSISEVPPPPRNLRIEKVTPKGFSFTCDIQQSSAPLLISVEMAGHTEDTSAPHWKEVHRGAGITSSIGSDDAQAPLLLYPNTKYMVRCCVYDQLGHSDWVLAPSPICVPLARLTWDPASCFQVVLSDSNCTATSTDAFTVWTSQEITTGSLAVVNLRVMSRKSTCTSPCIGVAGKSLTGKGKPTDFVYKSVGFWGFNLAVVLPDKTRHNGKGQPQDPRYGYENTPTGALVTMIVDMTQSAQCGTMRVLVNGLDRGVCCTGLPSPLRVAFTACCGGHSIKLE
ncbi:hypothetical protein Pelo_15043 [Pelomyxa schiedti]|nr:hypothetical protein Pelo_15043 [Pelomyxa schiedti]